MATKIKISGRALEVLHVEDNPGDAVILREVLKGAGFPANLHRVKDGEEALVFLGRREPYFSAPLPDVILLDLKLPKKDGLTVLNEIKQNASWRLLPVIVLTASDSDLDLTWAQRFNASHYMIKPSRLGEFDLLVRYLRGYWIKTFQKLPEGNPETHYSGPGSYSHP